MQSQPDLYTIIVYRINYARIHCANIFHFEYKVSPACDTSRCDWLEAAGQQTLAKTKHGQEINIVIWYSELRPGGSHATPRADRVSMSESHLNNLKYEHSKLECRCVASLVMLIEQNDFKNWKLSAESKILKSPGMRPLPTLDGLVSGGREEGEYW